MKDASLDPQAPPKKRRLRYKGTHPRRFEEKYKELKPDLTTMDITMPEKDGIQALEEILTIDEDAKVIVITAIDQREALMEAIRSGATDYIIKPFETDRVLSAVKKVFGEG